MYILLHFSSEIFKFNLEIRKPCVFN